MKLASELKIGEKATYVPEFGDKEQGIVKSYSKPFYVLVVYKCNNEDWLLSLSLTVSELFASIP